MRHQLQLQQDIQKTVTTKSGIDSAYISIGTHSLAGRHSILAINFRNVHKQFNQSQHNTKKMAKITIVVNSSNETKKFQRPTQDPEDDQL